MEKKYTLITGASSGMGALCAQRLSFDRKLILASENYELLNEVKSKCGNSDNHILWHCDFNTQRTEIYDSLSDILIDNDIVIDSYIHFAGITKILPIKGFTISYVDSIFNVNFFSIIEILRVLLKKSNKKSLERVVLISALYSIRGNIGNSIYAASKGAMNSLVYSLAQELAPKIKINTILPGAIETPMTANLDKKYKEQIERDTPLGFGSMDDVINFVEFLLSDKAKWITGQNFIVDGGRSTK